MYLNKQIGLANEVGYKIADVCKNCKFYRRVPILKEKGFVCSRIRIENKFVVVDSTGHCNYHERKSK